MATNPPISPPHTDQAAQLSDVISAVSERIHYAEGRRNSFTVVAGALLAGGVAILTFILDKHLGKLVTYPAIVAAAVSIALGVVLLVAYARQTNRYPWTSATQTWKWFYRDALPDEKEFNPRWWSFFWFGPEKKRLQAAYTSQLPRFSDKISGLSDAVVSSNQDVQQLYVLHINEKFKNLHLSQLRAIFQIGVCVFAVMTTIAAVYGASADRRRVATRHLSERAGGLILDASWRFLSTADENQTVFVHATIENAECATADLPKWSFRDDQGLSVPAVVTASTNDVQKLPPGIRLSYSLFVKPAEPMPVQSLTARLK